MDRTSKYLALALVLIVLAVILVFAQRDSRRPKTGFNVQVAANTCACSADSPRIVVLHIYSREGLAINSESVPHGQLAGRLREIYGTRAERVLYLFPENDIPSQRIAEVIDVVKHLQSEKIKGLPVPRELRTAPENMNIQIRLVTLGALSAPCPKGCFNWGTQGLPVSPAPAQARRESSIEKQVAVLIEKTLNEKTERQEFSDLEALGCPAVPAIIERMDDRRSLPDPHISLRNKSPQAFEEIVHYHPKMVVDALATILSQLTGRGFGFISNGASDAKRTKTVHGWRDFLSNTPAAKLCDVG